MVSLVSDFVKKLYDTGDACPPSAVKVSFYHPNLPSSKEFESSAKSHLLMSLKSSERLKNFPQVPQKIASSLLPYLIEERKEDKDRGMAVFTCFEPAKVERVPDAKVAQEITVSTLSLLTIPDVQVTVDTEYDTRMLFRIDRKGVETLILKIEEKEITLYMLIGDTLNKIESFENYFISDPHNRYIAQVSSGTGSIHHGAGHEKVKRQQESGNQYFLREVLQKVKTFSESNQEIKQIVVFYSSLFEENLPDVYEDLKYCFNNQLLVPVPETPPTEQGLKKAAQSAIQEAIKEKVSSSILDAKEEFSKFVMGWNDVFVATKNRKVRKLFISPSPQFLNKEQRADYFDTVEEQPYDITPHLTKQVFQNGGEVVVTEQLPLLIGQPVAAQLFY